MTKKILLSIIALACLTIGARAIEKDASGNYLIASAQDWQEFASGISSGTISTTANALLTADITITTTVGSKNAYCGTFDGQGHTLTLNINDNSRCCAPFWNIRNATLRNMTVDGTITGGIHVSGLVGSATGTNNVISDITIKATITTTSSHCGGFVGHGNTSNTTLNNCVFAGVINGQGSGSTIGALYGWSDGGNVVLNNCVECGTYTNNSTFNPLSIPAATTNNCYYLTARKSSNAASNAQQITTSAPENVLYGPIAVNGTTYYGPAIISGIEEMYLMFGDPVTPEPTVNCLGKTLTEGTDYSIAYADNDKGGTATLTITGRGDYAGAQTVSFKVVATRLNGSGTQDDPFTIATNEEWESFAANVNEGFSFSGQYVKLIANVAGSATVGLRSDCPFSGTFDGDGHTLTANIASTASGTGVNEQGVAPFHYIKDATIKNLRVAGTISAYSYHASGLVGFCDGTSLIENCVVSAAITVSTYGAGFIGHNLSTTSNIKDCIFEGTITNRNSSSAYVAGFDGWSYPCGISNCLERGTYVNCSGNNFNPISIPNSTTTNSFYLNAPTNSNALGTQVYTAVPDGQVGKQITVVGGDQYYALIKVSGIETRYKLTGDNVSPKPTVRFYDNTLLTEDTDYTLSYTDNDKGGTAYVNIHGLGDYIGDMAISFTIFAQQLAGKGTADNPYIIAADSDWEGFAAAVEGGFNYSGQHIRLDADINVRSSVGIYDSDPFSGTFDGNGHTLHLNMVNTVEGTLNKSIEGVAPFHYIKNATIKNLRTDGTISSVSNHTAGLVGLCDGSNTIERCVVSATLNVRNYAAGFVGHGFNSGNTLRDCIFNGTINGNGSSTNIAGFYAWYGSSAKLINCLENGTYTNVPNPQAIGPVSTATNVWRIADDSRGTATTTETLADGSVTTALQASRDEVIWVQDIFTCAPGVALFANKMDYTVPASGIGTFSAAGIVSLPDGLEAYYTTTPTNTASGLAIKMAQLDGNVPAYAGVLLKGEPGQTYTLTAANTTDAAIVEDNSLMAVVSSTHVDATETIDGVAYTNFALKNGTFYPIAATSSNMKANKCYLHLPTSVLSSGSQTFQLLFDDDDLTGIATIMETNPSPLGETEGALIYDLTGRRVDTPVKGSIYIVNGKKIVY